MSIEKGGHGYESPESKRDHELVLAKAEMGRAKEFFQTEFHLSFDEAGFAVKPSAEQIERLAEWHDKVGVMPEMPTVESFYQKTLLAASLWRQEEDGKINYLFGKGAGVEIALLGEVQGRKKKETPVSYRPHSDFELYAVEYNAAANGANLGGADVYTDEFVKVFGGHEYFPVTKTKGLEDLPPDLLYKTAERVNLGGITLLVPQLEILFLDKWNAREATPRPEGFDDEVLARQYSLDVPLLHDYLQRFIVEPRLAKLEREEAEFLDEHFEAISRLYNAYDKNVEALNAELATFADRDIRYGGLTTKFWIPLEASQIDAEGKIIDEDLRKEIEKKIANYFLITKDNIVKAHERMDQYFIDLGGSKEEVNKQS